MKLRNGNKRSLNWLMVFFACLLSLNTANASTRHALVIGNSDYDEGALFNPRNDAIDMANQLVSMGYEVFGGGPALDLDRIGIERTIRAFARSLPENANALFYFAGHGMATDNDNYLIPVRHRLEFLEQLPDRAVSLKSTVNLFKNANPEGINVVLLDACRDSPLARSYRSGREGLQRLNDIPRGVFIGYAADQGQVAKDGLGRNGTYTSELLQVMREQPDVIIEVAHKEVANRVFEKTDGEQFPVSENKVYGDWCFGRCDDQPAAPLPLLQEPATVAVKEPFLLPENEPAAAGLNWKTIGGIALGILVVGYLANNDDDDGDDEGESFQLVLQPPQ